MEDLLIEAVQMYPCLFNKNANKYKNKLATEKAWTLVAVATGASVKQCQSRWRSLRDRYVQESAGITSNSSGALAEKCSWRYLEAMSFLQQHIVPRRTLNPPVWSSPQEAVGSNFEFVAEIMNDEASCSFHSSTKQSTIVNDSDKEVEENISPRPQAAKRPKMQKHAYKRFDELCGDVSDFIASNKEDYNKSRNEDFLKVLDGYLLKHSEEEQDRLKIQMLNLVYINPKIASNKIDRRRLLINDLCSND